ncbi:MULTISPECIES: winged helix-turn-helix domain-containing protein [unclassified Variovorax]|uniref:winged helix-turn-helix domain-containing protein n=1 Tax=unclassified Variovorax TaxID=663243 RepID=UPI003F44F7FC
MVQTAVDLLAQQHQSTAPPLATFDLLGNFANALHAGQRFGLVLLTFPSGADIHWLQAIRGLTDAPVLFATNADGADALQRISGQFPGEKNFDFVLPPFNLEEIKSKAQRLLNRAALAAPRTAGNELLVYRGYRFQIGERKVFHEGHELRLQPREYDLALELFRNRDCLMSRERLHTLLWRDIVNLRSRALDVCVFKIRRKLNLEPVNGLMLRSVFGQGYKLQTVTSSAG